MSSESRWKGRAVGEDEDQIRRTLAEYSQRCDDGRFDEWADLFTEDARFVLSGQVTEGRDSIRNMMTAMMPPDGVASTSPPTR